MPVLTPTERIGQRLGDRYEASRVLASGGMGVVFEGRDVRTGRRVAIKVLRPERCRSSQARLRMQREARAAAKLEHPHIVKILDVGECEDGTPFLVMELLEGEPLADYLDRRGSLSLEETFEVMFPVIGAVALAHAAGVVHRDLKPSNVLLSSGPGGRVVPVLLDFGIAKSEGDTTLTATGDCIGTPSYMSPEQAAAECTDPRSDVWSLGVMLYHCLSGQLPFGDSASARTLLRVVHEEPEPLARRVPELPPRLAAAIHRALEKHTDLRYESAEELALGLVRASLQCEVRLPSNPDPVGLAAWPAWLAGEAAMGSTVGDTPDRASRISVPPEPFASSAQAARRGPPRSTPEAMPSVATSKSRPIGRRFVGTVGALVLAGLLTWAATRPAAPPQSDVPAVSPRTSAEPASSLPRKPLAASAIRGDEASTAKAPGEPRAGLGTIGIPAQDGGSTADPKPIPHPSVAHPAPEGGQAGELETSRTAHRRASVGAGRRGSVRREQARRGPRRKPEQAAANEKHSLSRTSPTGVPEIAEEWE